MYRLITDIIMFMQTQLTRSSERVTTFINESINKHTPDVKVFTKNDCDKPIYFTDMCEFDENITTYPHSANFLIVGCASQLRRFRSQICIWWTLLSVCFERRCQWQKMALTMTEHVGRFITTRTYMFVRNN